MYLPDITLDKETVNKINNQFDYTRQVNALYSLELKRQLLQKELDNTNREIEEIRSNLPNDIIKQYEMLRVFDKLKGSNEGTN